MNELFGLGKKTSKASPKSSVIAKKGTSLVFDTGSEMDKSSATFEQLQAYDWKAGALSWLYQSKFKATYIDISVASEKVHAFQGVWLDGNFKGERFLGAFMGGFYDGGLFVSPYDQWKTSPFNFINGTIGDTTKGVLGITKVNPSVYDVKSPHKSVSLLAIPIGWHVNIVDSNNMTHSFRVDKMIDKSDSNFILQSLTGSKNKAIISWAELRGSNEMDFKKNTTITAGVKFEIPKVFVGDPIARIVSIEVSPKPTAATSPSSSTRVYKFDLSLLSPFTFKGSGGKKPLVTLSFDTQQEVDEYSKILAEIKNGWFSFHLKRIVNALKFNVIDGYGKNVYLQDIFAGEEGIKKAPKEIQDSLNWLEHFLRVLVLNIVKSKKVKGRYVDSPTIQKMILNQIAVQIQTYLGHTSPVPSSKKTTKPTTGGSKGKTAIIKESISKMVFRKIFENQ